MKAPMTSLELMISVSRAFVERSEKIGLKGVKRDLAALEFVSGAMTACIFLDNVADLSVLAFLVSTRGYSAIVEQAKREP